ncbi:hypothetical protein K458DRAFT_391607 [Lentithecium fluviatile CBS 122367]|uniref:Uncharacterized protein n=1 Tax=Lentithecium fluviatile CBS 122367 TaxID=1168545 RepID=A0A6G1IUM9_9PLEO|nr:hypothetical protein K458DRAFT_391607 [Lentithecium fluviatile CBS 122367]
MLSSRPVVTPTPSLTSSSSITSNIPTPQPSTTDTVIVDSVSLTPSPTSPTSQPTVPPVAAADPPRTMKPAQIAGLSVAAAATFIIAIGLMALSVFLRRRRERKIAAETYEKPGMSPSSPSLRIYSTRFSHYYPSETPRSEPPKRFPMPPAPVLRAPGDRLKVPPPTNARAQSPSGTTNAPQPRSNVDETSDLSSVHPLFRPGAGIRSSSSKSSLPLEQIGLAISAELPGDALVSNAPPHPLRKSSMRQKRRRSVQPSSELSQRPDTVCTQDTVFEEDEVRDNRRESRLLPMPPIPIPPIRSFQPSRKLSNSNPSILVQAPTQPQQPPLQPELFLDIPVRHSRSAPIRILPTENTPQNAPAPSPQAPPKPQLAPAIQIPQRKRSATNASASELSGGDIPDYYFTAWQDSKPKGLALSISPSRLQRPQELPNVKPKLSSSTLSRANSTASTNIRDSFSSQTSFETVDRNDPTPEDEDDGMQLDGSKLSPVAESPISNLRYPKVPRASNVFVPRSPRSPLSLNSQDSPQRAPSPSSLFVKRRGEQGALRLDSPVQNGSPLGSEARLQTRRFRQHLRTTSDETWSTLRTSERSIRTQSGQWPKSPAMYEPDVVRPLTIRSKIQLPPPMEEMQSLKSPAWVPRLTPTRQGEDLLISVTYSKPGR